jgi:hypothetical protein
MESTRKFEVVVIAHGDYIDHPYGLNDDSFLVEVTTIRLGPYALNEWLSAQMSNTRDCYEDGEAGDLAWEQHKAEYEKRAERWKFEVLCALRIETGVSLRSISITQAQAEVFTVMRIRKMQGRELGW